MTLIANIGPKGLYLLFVWLISAAIAGWMGERKGYGERVGLTFGLILSVIGLLIMIILPGRPGSKWREQGWRPGRNRGPAAAQVVAAAPAPTGAPPGEAPAADGPAAPPPGD
jgi:hypothetical protein